jgi:hypothetical protein
VQRRWQLLFGDNLPIRRLKVTPNLLGELHHLTIGERFDSGLDFIERITAELVLQLAEIYENLATTNGILTVRRSARVERHWYPWLFKVPRPVVWIHVVSADW